MSRRAGAMVGAVAWAAVSLLSLCFLLFFGRLSAVPSGAVDTMARVQGAAEPPEVGSIAKALLFVFLICLGGTAVYLRRWWRARSPEA